MIPFKNIIVNTLKFHLNIYIWKVYFKSLNKLVIS